MDQRPGRPAHDPSREVDGKPGDVVLGVSRSNLDPARPVDGY